MSTLRIQKRYNVLFLDLFDSSGSLLVEIFFEHVVVQLLKTVFSGVW